MAYEDVLRVTGRVTGGIQADSSRRSFVVAIRAVVTTMRTALAIV